MDAITVKNLTILYKPLNKISIRQNILKKRKKSKPIVAINDVSFSVKKGEIVGIIGKNGSGKSTLLKSIANIFSPDQGTIELYGQKVSLLALGAGFLPEMTGRKNIYISGMLLGFTQEEIKKKEQDIIDFAEIGDFIDMPVKTYSSGMYSKLSFAITATLDSNILLIDEVLSVGDVYFKEKSYSRMKELISDKDRTVVIVSHEMNTILETCDNVLWINDGKIQEYGNPVDVVSKYRQYMRAINVGC